MAFVLLTPQSLVYMSYIRVISSEELVSRSELSIGYFLLPKQMLGYIFATIH